MPNTNLQEQFFDLLLSRFPRRADAVEEICELLHLAKDAIYRRMRGDTFLSPNELATLAQHYHISLDALMLGQTNNVLFEYNAFSQKLHDFSDYLSGFIADLGAFASYSECTYAVCLGGNSGADLQFFT